MQFIRTLRKWHNEAIFLQFGHDPIKLFFARVLGNVLVGCTAILLVFTLVFVSFDHSIIKMLAKVSTVLINGSLIVAFAWGYKVLRDGKYDLARDMFVGVAVAGILVSITITGGFPSSSVTQCIIVVPVIVYLFYGRKAGTTIAFLSPLVIGLQWMAVKAWGVTLPNVSSQTNAALSLFMLTFIVYILVVFLVAVFEHRQSLLHKELVAERKKLSDLVNKDPLTGLYNFRYFHEQLDKIGENACENNRKLALFYLDLNFFKDINDKYGHCAGNDVLQATADRVKNMIGPNDVLARIGGDEFVLLVTSDISRDSVAEWQEKILRQIAEPIDSDGTTIKVTASIGSSIYPLDTNSPGKLVEAADRDMYLHKAAAKSAGLPENTTKGEQYLAMQSVAPS